MQSIMDQLFTVFDINIHIITPAMVIMTLISSLITGFIISLIYIKTHKGDFYEKTLPLSLLILCAVIATIILVVGNNVARAFSLGGSLAIIRYRIELREPKDVAFIFFTMAAGLACGAGFFVPAVMLVAIVGIVIIIATKYDFGAKHDEVRILKVIMPDNTEFEQIFTDVFGNYTSENKLLSVRTSGLGTLYEVAWTVKLKSNISVEKFLNDLREKNSNLKVYLLFNKDLYDDRR